MSNVSKNSIRKSLILRRKNLSDKEISLKSAQIFNNLLKIDKVLTSKKVLLYLPINNEVETAEILDYFKNKESEIYLPAYFDCDWVFSRLITESDLITGPFGTLQPKDRGIFEDDLDLAIIPGVGFSRNLIRLGYGKGLYDKLLADSGLLKVGLGYDFQIVDNLPLEQHDLRMDFVVTDLDILSV